MRISKIVIYGTLFFCLLTSCSLRAQSPSHSENEGSCRRFVDAFYNWYVTEALKDNVGPASDLALRFKADVFDPELLRRLKQDSEAQADAKGEIVGLDFDPFLNSQDPGERYTVGNITRKGERYWVEVYGVWSGKKSDKANVVPELMIEEGKWRFVNFHYGPSQNPRHENLLGILQGLRENRQKQRN